MHYRWQGDAQPLLCKHFRAPLMSALVIAYSSFLHKDSIPSLFFTTRINAIKCQFLQWNLSTLWYTIESATTDKCATLKICLGFPGDVGLCHSYNSLCIYAIKWNRVIITMSSASKQQNQMHFNVIDKRMNIVSGLQVVKYEIFFRFWWWGQEGKN